MNRSLSIYTPIPFWQRLFGRKAAELETREIVDRAWSMYFSRFESSLSAETVEVRAQLVFYVQFSAATRVTLKRSQHLPVGSHELADAMMELRRFGEERDINTSVARHLCMDLAMLLNGADDLHLNETTRRLIRAEITSLAQIR